MRDQPVLLRVPRTPQVVTVLARRSARSLLLALALLTAGAVTVHAQESREWPMHSMDRPRPAEVDPGPFTGSVPPPSDAIVLFDGASLAAWRSGDDSARWRLVDGHLEVVAGTGSLTTRRSFGDVQLHVEWRTPSPPRGDGQGRGNSGVFLMERYEVQVLDSWRNPTYADGQAASLYGQHPPLVNASRPPGEWQSFDIIFRRPRFDASGRVLAPARMTVFHNGVLVHDNAEVIGPTSHQVQAPYEAHADRLPIALQDHGDPVRFRNIWVRELSDGDS